MDTLTHALVGCAIADAAFRKRLGPRSIAFAMIIGAAPDVDFLLTATKDFWAIWTQHRGITHSLFIQLAVAPILGLLGWLWNRRRGGLPHWMALAFLPAAAHSLCDAATSWGTMLWLPFSQARAAWDAAPVLDLFMLFVFLSSFIICRYLWWREPDEIRDFYGSPPPPPTPRRQRAAAIVARVALLLAVLYLAAGLFEAWEVRQVARKELAKAGFVPIDVRAIPTPVTRLVWEVSARDAAGNIQTGLYSIWNPKPIKFLSFPASTDPLAIRALDSDIGKTFQWYSQGMVSVRLPEPPEPDVVILDDRMSASLADRSLAVFSIRLRVGEDGRIAEIGRDSRMPRDIKAEFSALWSEITGGE